jgi:glycosyltransferase involved in cell wall biosynthesis
MKILMVVHGFPPESEGGAERVAFFQARELAKRHQVTVLHRVNHPNQLEYKVREEEAVGFRRISVNNTFKERPNFHWLYRNPKIDDILRKVFTEEKPDIVHIHHLTGLSTGLIPIAKEYGSKVVLTIHDFWMLCPRGQRLKTDLTWCSTIDAAQCGECVAGWMIPPVAGKGRLPEGIRRFTSPFRTRLASWLVKAKRTSTMDSIKERDREMWMVMEGVDLLTAPSRFMRDSFIEAGVSEKHIIKVPNGMDPNLFSKNPPLVPPYWRRGEDKLRIGYIGSLIPSKGLHLLIEACAKLPQDKFTLDIYGAAVPYDGFPNYENDLLRKGASLSNVRFHGKYSNREVGKILTSLDVVVLPSLWQENAPLTIEEAFLAKVPVVAAGWGGMKERIAEGGGILFKPGDKNSLVDTLRHLIEHPDEMESLRKSIPKVASAEELAPVWEEIYQELLAIK